MKLKQFIQQETVLTAAAVLAVVSAFFVPVSLYTSPSPRDGLLSRMPSSA